jgi:hypothetical protein
MNTFLNKVTFPFLLLCITGFSPSINGQQPEFVHFSSAAYNLSAPNQGNQQTATAVFDVDKDGINDFLVTERTQAPSVVWYQRSGDGWTKYIVDDQPLRIEAGSAVADIDGDGDEDVVFGGDSGSNQVWWWENPYPDYTRGTPWERHIIKNFGATKHHDQIFGDFDVDDQPELVFWNQGARTLFMAEIPSNPRTADQWECVPIYQWGADEAIPQRGTYPGWKGKNEHEGLAKFDIDADGILDIVGGGRWFKRVAENKFAVYPIDESYAFSRSAAAQLVPGGLPEVVLVVGDGNAPLIYYEYRGAKWHPTVLIESVQDGHSLDLVDYNSDGHLDIFCAEMRLGNNPDAKAWILLGDGKGNFAQKTLLKGFGLHESRMIDLDGDSDLDILGKPYTWKAPRLDVWLNQTQ